MTTLLLQMRTKMFEQRHHKCLKRGVLHKLPSFDLFRLLQWMEIDRKMQAGHGEEVEVVAVAEVAK